MGLMGRVVFGIVVVLSLLVFSLFFLEERGEEEIKVGVLHSLTGTMAMSEKRVAEATIATIEEINRKGGILGKKIVPIIKDGASDPKVFAQKAEDLIEKDGVKAIFGCWTSASRKEVKKVVERFHHLLFYPVQYEGVESSDSIVYLGQLPNQQIKPALFFALKNIGTDFYLLGSDYIFPRVANEYLKDLISITGSNLVGERYVKLGEESFEAIVSEIKDKKPDVIFNTINGDSNIHFFKELYKNGITSKEIPVISFSIGENELKEIVLAAKPEAIIGHYASWSYFDTINSPQAQKLRDALKANGIIRPTDPMDAAHSAVWLYKQAVESAGSFDPYLVKKMLPFQSFSSGGGITTITNGNLNSWKNSYIGKINKDLEFDVIDGVNSAIKPENYPSTRTKDEWEEMVNHFYIEWGGNWIAK